MAKKMIMENATDLGEDAIRTPGKYKGFIGISLLQRYFSPKRIAYFIDWGAKQFEEFAVLIMDHPEVYNFIAFNGLTEKDAMKKADEISDERKRSYEKVINGLGIDNVRIVQFRDVVDKARYKELDRVVRAYDEKDRVFHRDLMDTVLRFIGGKIDDHCETHGIVAAGRVELVDFLFQHLREEIVGILYLVEEEYLIEIEPQIEFSTKKKIYEHAFPEMLAELQQKRRGHINIYPEGIPKYYPGKSSHKL